MITADQTPTRPVNHQGLLQRMLYRIRRSQELAEILQLTAMELQAFLAVDRVKIYQFHPDGSGQVAAEALHPARRLPSLYGLNFPADDIPPATRQLFIEARVRNVVDVAARKIGQSQLRDPATGELLTGELSWRPLDPCHAEYLTTMGVSASVVAPILHEDQLWGLIVAHHADPLEVEASQLQGIQLLVEQLSVTIAHTMLLTQVRAKAEREATINQITRLLDSLTEIELQQALEVAVEAFQGSGGRLFLHRQASDQAGAVIAQGRRIYTCGRQPIIPLPSAYTAIEDYHCWASHFQMGADTPRHQSPTPAPTLQPWAIHDLYQVSELRNLQPAFRPTAIRSILTVPLSTRQQIIGYLTVFRDELDTEILWAGQSDPDVRQSSPRQSFAIWRESKTGQAHPWTAADLELAQALGNRFATAIDQYELYHQVQSLNANLEAQVQERTTQLTQTLQTLQQTQTQLIQNEKMTSLGQLVAGVAHEINNPVNFIHGNLTHVGQYVEDALILLRQYQQHLPYLDATSQRQAQELDLDFIAEDLPKSIASMKLGTERICQIVQSLRTFSRLDQAEVKPVDIHAGIESTLLILQHRLKAKSDRAEIQVIQDYGASPLVECYAGALNQVFMNLISNAIDALEEKAAFRSPAEIAADPLTIRITTRVEQAETIQVAIADNGLGIPEAIQQHLFDPFFTTKPVGKGTGLGLSISYQIVTEKHQGRLMCQSELGRGTTFILTIPVRMPPPQRA